MYAVHSCIHLLTGKYTDQRSTTLDNTAENVYGQGWVVFQGCLHFTVSGLIPGEQFWKESSVHDNSAIEGQDSWDLNHDHEKRTSSSRTFEPQLLWHVSFFFLPRRFLGSCEGVSKISSSPLPRPPSPLTQNKIKEIKKHHYGGTDLETIVSLVSNTFKSHLSNIEPQIQYIVPRGH